MEKRIETAINLIMFLSLLATAWDLSLVHHLPGNSAAAPALAPLNRAGCLLLKHDIVPEERAPWFSGKISPD